jgi:hypothetical protein
MLSRYDRKQMPSILIQLDEVKRAVGYALAWEELIAAGE